MAGRHSLRLRWAALAATGLLVAGGATVCGDDDAQEGPVAGGTLRVVLATEPDSIDPGATYTTDGASLARATVRTLVSYVPDGAGGEKLVGDLATDTGTVSEDRLTFTFTLRPEVRYPPKVAGGRQVRSEDVRYAIERGFNPNVGNPYARNYFHDVIEGDNEHIDGKAGHIAGIDVADPKVVVFHLRRPTGDFRERLTMNLAAPVPEEHAKAHDAKSPSTYGPHHASSGPYMIVKYQKEKLIRLERNPNWERASDPVRQARPDAIEVHSGHHDEEDNIDRVVAGEYDVTSSYSLGENLERVKAEHPRQLHIIPSPCYTYLALNTTLAPFDRPLVRQAVALAVDKAAARDALGGPDLGALAPHFLVDGVAGYAEAGGAGYDPYATPGAAGDEAAAQDKMRAAGYPTGRYDGPPLRNATIDDTTTKAIDAVVSRSLARIGIQVKDEVYPEDKVTDITGDPASGIGLLLSGWCWDYPDAITLIPPLFDGRLITPHDNTNASLNNDPDLNALIDQARLADGPQRAALWAKADQRVMQTVPAVPLTISNGAFIVSPRVEGTVAVRSLGGLDLTQMTLNAPDKD